MVVSIPEIPVFESKDAPLTTKVCWCFVKYNCTARSQSEDANEAVSAFPEVFGGEQHQRPSWSQIIKCILLWLCSPVTCSKKQSCQIKLPGNQGIFEICLIYAVLTWRMRESTPAVASMTSATTVSAFNCWWMYRVSQQINFSVYCQPLSGWKYIHKICSLVHRLTPIFTLQFVLTIIQRSRRAVKSGKFI